MKNPKFITINLLLATLAIYLFATAPPPLDDAESEQQTIPISLALDLIDKENKIVRSIYTKQIVIPGIKNGLAFDENWKDGDIDSLPLPAQFLRLIAKNLETMPEPLSLFLGSDFPINTANNFSELQNKHFATMKETGHSQFFHMTDINRYIYMTADIAISNACVKCHNKHKDSPKTNWKLNEIMGATTWSHPDQKISLSQMVELIYAFRTSVRLSYQRILDKASQFKNPPVISTKWPADGYMLPSIAALQQEINNQAAHNTLQTVILLSHYEQP